MPGDKSIVISLKVDDEEFQSALSADNELLDELVERAAEIEEAFNEAYANITEELEKYTSVSEESAERIAAWIEKQELSADAVRNTITMLQGQGSTLSSNSADWRRNETAVENLRGAYDRAASSNTAWAQANNSTVAGLGQTNSGAGNLQTSIDAVSSAFTGLGTASQGIGRIIEGFQLARTAVMGVNAASKILSATLMGGGGLMLGIGAIVSLLPTLINLFSDQTDEAESQAEAVDKLIGKYQDLSTVELARERKKLEKQKADLEKEIADFEKGKQLFLEYFSTLPQWLTVGIFSGMLGGSEELEEKLQETENNISALDQVASATANRILRIMRGLGQDVSDIEFDVNIRLNDEQLKPITTYSSEKSDVNLTNETDYSSLNLEDGQFVGADGITYDLTTRRGLEKGIPQLKREQDSLQRNTQLYKAYGITIEAAKRRKAEFEDETDKIVKALASERKEYSELNATQKELEITGNESLSQYEKEKQLLAAKRDIALDAIDKEIEALLQKGSLNAAEEQQLENLNLRKKNINEQYRQDDLNLEREHKADMLDAETEYNTRLAELEKKSQADILRIKKEGLEKQLAAASAAGDTEETAKLNNAIKLLNLEIAEAEQKSAWDVAKAQIDAMSEATAEEKAIKEQRELDLQLAKDKESELYQNDADYRLAIEEKYAADSKAITERMLAEKAKAYDKIAGIMTDLLFGQLDEQTKYSSASVELSKLEHEKELDDLEDQYKEGTISHKEYMLRKQVAEEEYSNYLKTVEEQNQNFIQKAAGATQEYLVSIGKEYLKEYIKKKLVELTTHTVTEATKTGVTEAASAERKASLLEEVYVSLKSAAASIVDAISAAIKWQISTFGFFAIASIPASIAAIYALFNGVKQTMGFAQGGRLKQGEPGYFEGYGNEIIAPERTFVDVFRNELRPQIYSGMAGGDNSGLAEEIKGLRSDLQSGGIKALAYYDDRETRRIYNRANGLNRKRKI